MAHFDGQGWTIVRGASPLGRSPVRPGIAWAAPGLAVLIGSSVDGILEISSVGGERAVFFEYPVRVDTDAPYSVAHIEGLGVVVGTYYDIAYRRNDAEWLRLELPLATPSADVILDLGDRTFIAGGEDGIYVQWTPDGKACAPLIGLGGMTADRIAPLGNGFVMITGSDLISYTSYIATRQR